jgi:hypothetical protein
MDIPGLGPVTRDDEFGWYRGEPRPIGALLGATCEVVVDGYDDDPDPASVHAAIATFLALDDSALRAAAPSIFDYYRYIMADVEAEEDWDWYVEIAGPDDVLGHVTVGPEVMVQREPYGDGRVYVSVECECDWEPEHGLQIVFREGRTVSKVGPYNGHLTNASAYARDDLVDVIYHRPG